MEAVTHKVGQVAGGIVKRLLLVGVAIKGAQALWRKFNQYVPEFGKAFQIAGGIFFKNLFWPLRQLLMPLLQRMLNWVRDHRTMFIRWGQTLANVVRAGIALVKQLVRMFRTLTEAVGPAFKRLFGQSFSDFLNLLVAKIAVVAEFLGRVLRTVISGLAEGLGNTWENIKGLVTSLWDLVSAWFRANEEGKSFWTLLHDVAAFAGEIIDFITKLAKEFAGGLKDSLSGVMTPLSGVVDALRGMWKVLADIDKQSGVFSMIARGLGLVVGEAIMASLQTLWVFLEGVRDMLEWIPIGIERIKAIGNPSKIADVRKQAEALAGLQDERSSKMFQSIVNYWKSQGKAWGETLVGPKQVQDAMITKRGEVVQFNPQDTIIAAKNPMRVGGVNVVVNLNVTEGGARAAGIAFAGGFTDEFRRLVLDSGVAGGL